ncbi:hypothetical protein HDV02_002885, partial [Globomyces sp. JEL0801]
VFCDPSPQSPGQVIADTVFGILGNAASKAGQASNDGGVGDGIGSVLKGIGGIIGSKPGDVGGIINGVSQVGISIAKVITQIKIRDRSNINPNFINITQTVLNSLADNIGNIGNSTNGNVGKAVGNLLKGISGSLSLKLNDTAQIIKQTQIIGDSIREIINATRDGRPAPILNVTSATLSIEQTVIKSVFDGTSMILENIGNKTSNDAVITVGRFMGTIGKSLGTKLDDIPNLIKQAESLAIDIINIVNLGRPRNNQKLVEPKLSGSGQSSVKIVFDELGTSFMNAGRTANDDLGMNVGTLLKAISNAIDAQTDTAGTVNLANEIGYAILEVSKAALHKPKMNRPPTQKTNHDVLQTIFTSAGQTFITVGKSRNDTVIQAVGSFLVSLGDLFITKTNESKG